MAVEQPSSSGAHARNAVYAIVMNSPATATDDLFVRIPSTFNPEPVGPVPWSPRPDEMPAAGDECLVLFDERGNPWVIAYAT